MATLIQITYEIYVEEMTKEKIEELIYQHIDVGLTHEADIIDLVIEEEE